jgi:REP element-mobilizing transposase RayT
MARVRRRPVQLALPLRAWGGRRKGAGRKPKEGRQPGWKPGPSHLRRPALNPRYPVHVTMRLCKGLPSLRQRALAALVFAAFRAARQLHGARLVHFTVQTNHIHLIAEAADHRALSRAMHGLAIRLARRLNGRLERRGAVFAERYHARALRTPLEIRRALVYVFHNHTHHQTGAGRPIFLDPMSTAAYFDGFSFRPRRPRHGFIPPEEPPVAGPDTWLLRVGWAKRGALSARDVPTSSSE